MAVKPAEDLRIPLPYFAEGTVVAGFGRGSKELGIPTANFPEHVIEALPGSFECGVYYGWAQVAGADVHKMTMCVGWNPYYHNTVKTMETHILHKFEDDFYGEHLKIVVLGFIRPMCNFPSLDALIEAIHNDNTTASNELAREDHQQFKTHPFFSSPPKAANGQASGKKHPQNSQSLGKVNEPGEKLKPNGFHEHATDSAEMTHSHGVANGVGCNGSSKEVVSNGPSRNGDNNSSICKL